MYGFQAITFGTHHLGPLLLTQSISLYYIYFLCCAESPLSLNPTVENNNTHITLKWSPPFLWPGRPILYFNLSIVDWSRESPSHQIINSTFSERIVIFIFEINKSWIPENLTCTEITFSISAVGMHDSEPLEAINYTEWILPPCMYYQEWSTM